MTNLLSLIRARLLEQVDIPYRDGCRAFFKETINPLGVRAAQVNRLAAEVARLVRDWDTPCVWELCRALWATGCDGGRQSGLQAGGPARTPPRPGGLPGVGGLARSPRIQLGHCDDLCTHAIGSLLLHYKEVRPRTEAWIASPNRWLRRGAAVAFIPLAKAGELRSILARVDTLLPDSDDLVRKGLGWLLKEAGRRQPGPMRDYLLSRREQMARVALRIAVEKLPETTRREIMGKRGK
ncbi:DNA alkylation repair protein [Desulfovibrio aminophilus]|uniref:DNA alkylation repair protein n=1 Tax=Desulfovibrio aminophilus TaxID=81425 RepID=UPI000404B055|nr:DNA alkylation repair protein [Desulfovibrio aminophilus]